MANNLYDLFGLDEQCGDDELDAAYGKLRSKYAEDRFLEGEAGNEAARKLTEIDEAYREITAKRREKTNADSFGESDGLKAVEDFVKKGDLVGAQSALDAFNERGAEWHYLQSVVFYKKNWSNESKKQLEIAMQMDPSNQKYKTAYDKLVAKIRSESEKNFSSYGTGGGYYRDDASGRQMGGDACVDWCCQMAMCNALLNCCCNCR